MDAAQVPPTQAEYNLPPGSPPGSPGTILLPRGGELLQLERVKDRFTISLVSGGALKDLLPGFSPVMGPVEGRLLQPTELIEIQTTVEQLESGMQLASSSPTVAFVSPVYQMRQSPGTLLYPSPQITLQFAEMRAEQMHAIARDRGLQILKLVAGVPRTFVFQLTSKAADPLVLANQLRQLPEVLLAEPNVAVLRQPFYRPRESAYRQQWYLHHEGGDGLASGSHIFAESAWDITRGKRSIVVAVVDDGVDLNHPDFQSEGKIVAPLDLCLNQNGQPHPNLSPNHGTGIARLAVADETGKGMLGVAPGCALMPIRVGEFLDDQTVERFCQWVIDKGADVVCCGWGAAAVQFPLSLRQQVALMQVATQGRDGRGCVVVFAAGNANRPIDGIVQEQGWPDVIAQSTPMLQGQTHWLNGFAVHPDIISVAACTSLNRKAAYSNWGVGISLAAPGGDAPPTLYTQQIGTLAVAPAVSVPPEGSPVQAGQPIYLSPDPVATGQEEPGGTSSACAMVAGVAGLMLSVNPDLTAREVRQILEQTADRVVDREPDPQLGQWLGSYNANRYSAWFGHGKVNAAKALQLAQSQYLTLPLPHRWITYASSHPVEIPDGDAQGIKSLIQVSHTELIRDLEIMVEVEHEFLGDLEISLIPPWSTAIPLQSRSLGRLTQLKTTYSLENSLWLKTALHRSAQGEWHLHLIDRIPTCVGRLQQWQLNLGF